MNRATEQPYVGLEPFTQDQEKYFFGRRREVRIIAANLAASRLSILFGPSGVGKSSVLRAGVVPRLEAPVDEDVPGAVVVYFNRWQSEGFLEDLKQRCITQAQAASSAPIEADNASPLDTVVRAASDGSRTSLLLILDQFEEYLVHHPESPNGNPFEAELASLVNTRNLDVNVLVALREDWLSKLHRFDVRIPNFFGNQLRLNPLSLIAAARAIHKPLRVFKSRYPDAVAPAKIESGLVKAILREATTTALLGETNAAGGSEGARRTIEPSLLQLVLVRLWNEEMRRGSRVLTLEAFRTLGGAGRIVQNHLADVMNRLTADQQLIAERIFRFLVMPQGNKIAQRTEDLVALAERPEIDVRAALSQLAAARILTQTYPPERYEITHDVLCPAVLDWSNTRAKQAAELRAEQKAKAARRYRNLSFALGAMFLLAACAAVIAYGLWTQSHSRELAAAATATLATDPELSVALALRGMDVRHTHEAENALHRAVLASRVRVTLAPHPDAVLKARFDPTGKVIATATQDGQVHLWNPSSSARLSSFAAHQGAAVALAFNADGSRLATGGADGVAKLWHVPPSAQDPVELPKQSGAVMDVAFSRDGQQLATAGADGTLRLWVIETRKELHHVRSTGGASFNAVAFSADGRWIASGDSSGSASVWQAADLMQWRPPFACEFAVEAVAFDPNNNTLLTASGRDVQVWDIGSSKKVSHARGAHGSALTAIAVDEEGRIATASLDGTAKIWTSALDRSIVLAGHGGPVTAVAFGPGGVALTGSRDGTARVWSTDPAGEAFAFRAGYAGTASISFTPDDKSVVAPADSGVGIWSAADGSRSSVFAADVGPVTAVRVSAKNDRAVTGGPDGVVRVWNTTSRRPVDEFAPSPEPIKAVAIVSGGHRVAAITYSHVYMHDVGSQREAIVYSGHKEAVNSIAFTRDGSTIASTGTKSIDVWEPHSGALKNRLEADRVFYGAAWSPDSRWIVASSDKGELWLWDGRSRAPFRIYKPHTTVAYAVAVSPDGSLIASAAEDGTIKVTTVSRGEELISWEVPEAPVRDLVFSADGERLLVEGSDRIVRMLLVDSQSLLDLARSRVTPSGWERLRTRQ